MNVRQAEKKDLEKICLQYENMYNILRSFGFPYKINEETIGHILEVFIKSKLCCLVVAEQDDIIYGFICASIIKLDRMYDTGEEKQVGIINDVYVDEQYRGQNVSQELLKYAEEWIKNLGINSVRAEVLTNNTPAFSFWFKEGYSPIYTGVCKNLN
jgi:GNAT superfamily N-acetyltransferase